MPHLQSASVRTILFSLAASLCNSALASWPTDPLSPLPLGDVQGVGFFDHHALATTPDHATWVAWIDTQCLGNLRVQRISSTGALLQPGGIDVFSLPGCFSTTARIAPCADNSVVVARTENSLSNCPIQRISALGKPMWGDGLIVSTHHAGTVGAFLGLSNGDALISWHESLSIFVDRRSPAGRSVWQAPAEIPVPHGSNMRIIDLVSDGADGAFIMWDTPTTYTRALLAARVSAAGQVVWPQPLLVSPPPGASRHTDPTAISDRAGGLLIAWTQGHEQSGIPAPIFLQRLSPLGQFLLPPDGLRASLASSQQFDPILVPLPDSSDLILIWRDGVHDQSIRAQRISLAGSLAWSSSGIPVTALPTSPITQFTAAWNGSALNITLALQSPSPALHVHRVFPDASLAPSPWIIAQNAPSLSINGLPVNNALVLTWVADLPSFDDAVVSHRLNPDGSLGNPFLPADITADGLVNIDDLVLIILNWNAQDSLADIAPPGGDGIVNIDDLALVILSWSTS